MQVSLVTVPARVWTGEPSPQLTVKEAIVPSGSVAEKVTVISVPVGAVAGVAGFTVTVGALSVMVSVPVAEPAEPLLSVAVTVMVKTLLVTAPVEV